MLWMQFISIHAPAKGATFTGDPLNVLSTDFNPRSREGSDYQHLLTFNNAGISIHAPAKGATLELDKLKSYSRISIHAPAKGATAFTIFSQPRKIFQSTLPRRERQHLLTSFRLQYGYFYFISPIKYSSCFKKIN